MTRTAPSPSRSASDVAWPESEEQAVLVTFRLPEAPPDDLLRRLDALVGSVEQAVERAGTGEVDGVQTRPGSATLFAYGPDAERLWRSIEPVVTGRSPRPARAVLRYGWFGAPDRTVEL